MEGVRDQVRGRMKQVKEMINEGRMRRSMVDSKRKEKMIEHWQGRKQALRVEEEKAGE